MAGARARFAEVGPVERVYIQASTLRPRRRGSCPTALRHVNHHYRTVLIPGLGMFGVMFGAWYAGLA